MCAKYASEGTEEKQRADAEDTRPQTSPSDARTVTESHNAEQQISLWPSGNAREQNTTLAALGDQQIPSLTTTNGSDSRFHALRQELGLSRANAPALRPRHNIDPFLIRLRPDQVRNEETLLAAVNDMVYNEQPVQMFMRLALTPAEATAVRDRQVAQVLSEFTDDSLTLRDALWYLEFVGWDVELAILQQLHDYIQRTEAPGPGSVQVDADFPAENLKLDRSPVLAGEDFDEEKLKVKYIQYGVERTKTYPDWLKVDRNNIHHIRALNKWRWKTIMAQVGLKPTNKRKSNEYHPLEILWLRNYERRNPKCLGREITQEYNATFEGRMLPGETHPRPHRSMAAIACLRLRKDGKKRKREKKGGQGREKGGLG